MIDKAEAPWDKEALYDEHISPLMTRIIALCKEHEIPMAATFQYVNDEENGPGFCSTSIPFPHQGAHMRKVQSGLKPPGPVVLAETIVTKPDGSKHISIRRVP